MVEEALVPGAKVSEIARTHGVDPSQLFGWRRKAMASGQIRPLDEGGGGERFTRFEAVRTDLVDICVGDATVRVNAAIDPELLSRILKVVRRS
jgi:transposase